MAIVKKETKVILELTEAEAKKVAALIALVSDPGIGGTDVIYNGLLEHVSEDYELRWKEDDSVVDVDSLEFASAC